MPRQRVIRRSRGHLPPECTGRLHGGTYAHDSGRRCSVLRRSENGRIQERPVLRNDSRHGIQCGEPGQRSDLLGEDRRCKRRQPGGFEPRHQVEIRRNDRIDGPGPAVGAALHPLRSDEAALDRPDRSRLREGCRRQAHRTDRRLLLQRLLGRRRQQSVRPVRPYSA